MMAANDDDVASLRTVADLIRASARHHGERPALWRWVDAGFEAVTYVQLLRASVAIAGKLQSRGAGIDRRVAIAVTERFSWGVVYLGTLFSGATVVPIDSLLTPREIGAILDDADVTLIIHDDRIDLGDHSGSEKVVQLKSIWPGFADQEAKDEFIPPAISPQDLAAIIFTSGTTGRTKGVMLSHGNIASDVEALQKLDLVFDTDVLLSVLPIHHAFESTAGFLFPLSIGAQIAFARSLKSKEILADLRATQATTIFAVPLLFENIVNFIQRQASSAGAIQKTVFSVSLALSRRGRRMGWRRAGRVLFAPMRKKAGLNSLRFFVSGGAALPPFVGEFCDTIGLPLLQGYGLTETSPVVSVNLPRDYRYDTVGPPIPTAEVTIADPRPDGIGEVAVKGPMVMQGYWKRPEETANVMRDGRFLTGDLGAIDEDGHLRICGRSKNLIVTGAGKNVYPEEVEAVLCARPEVTEAVVYGRTRPGKIGESVAAIVVPDEDWFVANHPAVLNSDDQLRVALTEAVKSACESLAAFKRVTDVKFQREPFEKTSTRKIKRFVVLKRHEAAYAPVTAATQHGTSS